VRIRTVAELAPAILLILALLDIGFFSSPWWTFGRNGDYLASRLVDYCHLKVLVVPSVAVLGGETASRRLLE
jgi:hypothetical protein